MIFIGGFHHDKVKPRRHGIFLILCQVSHLEQLLPNRLCFQQGWIRAAWNMSESSGSFVFLVSKTIQNIPNLKHVTEMCNSEPRNSTQFSYSTARCTCFVSCFHCFKVHAMVDPVHIHASRTTAPVGTS